MAHRKGSGERRCCSEIGPSRSPSNLRPALPRLWRRVRTDSVPLGTRFGSNHRTLSRLQAKDSISGERSYRYRARYLTIQEDSGRVADNTLRILAKALIAGSLMRGRLV